MIQLGAYLVHAAKLPWQWGAQDCTTHPGDWVWGLTGRDPIERWRGYSTDVEAEELISRAGGLLALWEQGLAGIMRRVETADPGDIGLIRMPGEDGELIEIGAIFTGKRWSFRSPRGVGAVSLDPENVVAIWGR
jgi:hypothetical protein